MKGQKPKRRRSMENYGAFKISSIFGFEIIEIRVLIEFKHFSFLERIAEAEIVFERRPR
jgi:hypothetical protein